MSKTIKCVIPFKNHKWEELATNSQDKGKYRATHICTRCKRCKARKLK